VLAQASSKRQLGTLACLKPCAASSSHESREMNQLGGPQSAARIIGTVDPLACAIVAPSIAVRSSVAAGMAWHVGIRVALGGTPPTPRLLRSQLIGG
jgi:hypothetical protein